MKLNTKTRARPASQSPIVTRPNPTLTTFEGGPGFERSQQGELFLLGVNNLGGEDTFYESGAARTARLRELVTAIAPVEPEWMAGFLGWLRGPGNMRTGPVMAAADATHAMLAARVPGSRGIVRSVLQRGDEPGELIAYWRSTYGRALPIPLRLGVNDAITGGLWDEYALLKYDTPASALRFGDIIALTRPVPQTPEQEALFRYALHRAGVDRGREYTFDNAYERARRFSERMSPLDLLPMVRAQAELIVRATDEGVEALFDADAVRAAGLTHQDVLSLAGKLPGGSEARARLWEALIPGMGYMALLRNLRGFDEAGLGADAASKVIARLSDPGRVAKSRQLPFRFLSAYEEAHGLRWGPALEAALEASLRNLPVLPGRSLILVDTSLSMARTAMSGKSKMTAQRAAAVFGVALCLRNPGSDLYGWADGTPFAHPVRPGMSLLREVDGFNRRNGEAGHGTDMAGAIRATYSGHDRVILMSDMQTIGGRWGVTPGSGLLPEHVPLYGFNLVGYEAAAIPSGHGLWHEFGGLTDATFAMIPLMEAGRAAAWPWMAAASA